MRVFVTGASGWIGSATVDELLDAEHEVVGLARSESSATALAARGAKVLRGDLDDLDGLRRGAADADAAVHLANKHDWENPAESNRAEHAAVRAIADTLAGSGRPFLLASAFARLAEGRPAVETDRSPFVGPESLRGGSENLALDYVERGVRSIIVRFPLVHGAGDPGFVSFVTAAARRHGVSGYVDDGSVAWSAVHRADAARLVRLALESAPGGTVLHAVAEEAVPTREIAAVIGDVLGVPSASVPAADAIEHFGFVGRFFSLDLAASSERTRELLGWAPNGPTLLEDIANGGYTG